MIEGVSPNRAPKPSKVDPNNSGREIAPSGGHKGESAYNEIQGLNAPTTPIVVGLRCSFTLSSLSKDSRISSTSRSLSSGSGAVASR